MQKDKQYKWLLSEAYEHYEILLEKIYAFLAYSDKSSWPLSDFGNIMLTEISEKPYEWYIERVKEKKGKPNSILSHLRNICPEISKVETTNSFGINIKLSICTIEMLRHVIVHQSGIVDNKALFIEKILKNAGLFQNGKPQEKYTNYIKNFFGRDNYESHINLLERYSEDSLSYIDILRLLIDHSMSYSFFIVECIKKRITIAST